MKFTIDTIRLQSMLSKVLKCAGEMPDRPLTELILIKLNDGELSLTTTDFTNYMVVKETGISGDNMEVVVKIKTFAPLISKMTSDLITLELRDDYLEVVGNGVYKIELILDDSGNVLTFPNPISLMPKTNLITTISSSTIAKIIGGLKQSLYVLDKGESEKPYTKYLVGETCLASNGYVISSLDTHVFDEYKSITTKLMNILGVVDDSSINVYANTKLNNADVEIKELAFESEHYSIYGLESSDVKDFPLAQLNDYFARQFDSSCVVGKSALLQLLGRISLFIDTYDNNAITLNFTNDNLEVSNKTSAGVEEISYNKITNPKEFVCLVNIKHLEPQIKAMSGDLVTIYYGDENTIKLTDNNGLTTVLALGE